MNMRNPPTANTLDATRLSLIALLFGFRVMSYFDRTMHTGVCLCQARPN